MRVKLIDDHNTPRCAKSGLSLPAPGTAMDPVAYLYPALPLPVRMLIKAVMMWFGIYGQAVQQMRRARDVVQIYELSMSLDVAALTLRAQQYDIYDHIAAHGPQRGQNSLCFAGQAMQTGSHIHLLKPRASYEFDANPRHIMPPLAAAAFGRLDGAIKCLKTLAVFRPKSKRPARPRPLTLHKHLIPP